jgi:TupA-like ATPgrasp
MDLSLPSLFAARRNAIFPSLGTTPALRTTKTSLLRPLRRLPLLGPAMIRHALIRRYASVLGAEPRLDPPVTFNEHILFEILTCRDPLLRVVADKLTVRDLIRNRVGPEYVVPLLGVWKNPHDIRWDCLPERFVVKPNHASLRHAIIKSRAEIDPSSLARQCQTWIDFDFFDECLEWHYRDLPRRILIEPLLVGPDGGPPPEAKVFTFGGRAEIIRLLTGSGETIRDQWFSRDGERLPLQTLTRPGEAELSNEMAAALVAVSERLAAGFRHIRVDFYLTDAGLRIGELTAFNVSGLQQFQPKEWDERLGALWPKHSIEQTPRGRACTVVDGKTAEAPC